MPRITIAIANGRTRREASGCQARSGRARACIPAPARKRGRHASRGDVPDHGTLGDSSASEVPSAGTASLDNDERCGAARRGAEHDGSKPRDLSHDCERERTNVSNRRQPWRRLRLL